MSFLNEELAQEIIVEYFQGDYYMEIKTKTVPIFSQIPTNKPNAIWPDDIVKIGDLEFQLLRFNVGVGWEGGSKKSEENFLVFQNFKISERAPCSLFSIIDG